MEVDHGGESSLPYTLAIFLFGAHDMFADSAASSHMEPEFVPHLVTQPATVGHLKFDYGPSPGMTAAGFGASSVLSLGLGESFEVGTVPLFFGGEYWHHRAPYYIQSEPLASSQFRSGVWL